MILNANSIHIPLADQSVHMAVTSPPYFGLRNYGIDGTHWDAVTYTPMAGLPSVTVEPWRGCLGLEPTPEMFVAHIVAVFREVKRVLRDDGTCWVNFGDSYTGGGGKSAWSTETEQKKKRVGNSDLPQKGLGTLKPKDLIGIPWRVAFALQADGWYLRNDIIWHKPNPMPESVTDRCTKSHEYLFLLAKSARYFYDNEAVKEDVKRTWDASNGGNLSPEGQHKANGKIRERGGDYPVCTGTRNRRTVWTISTTPYKGAHFATYPPDLVAPCILAGTSQRGVCPICGAQWERVTERTSTNHRSREDRQIATGGVITGGVGKNFADVTTQTTGWRPTCDHDAEPIPAVVLDPFCGSGTTGEVCNETGRKFVGLDLSARYLRDFALPRAENKQTQESIDVLPLFT